MGRKPKSIRPMAFRSGIVANIMEHSLIDRVHSARDLKYALEVEAQNCKLLSPSHPWELVILLRETAELLAVNDAEIAKLRAQIIKDANRLEWGAGLVQVDHIRDQMSAWADQARSVLDRAV